MTKPTRATKHRMVLAAIEILRDAPDSGDDPQFRRPAQLRALKPNRYQRRYRRRTIQVDRSDPAKESRQFETTEWPRQCRCDPVAPPIERRGPEQLLKTTKAAVGLLPVSLTAFKTAPRAAVLQSGLPDSRRVRPPHYAENRIARASAILSSRWTSGKVRLASGWSIDIGTR